MVGYLIEFYSMRETLLSQFIREECTPRVRSILLDALSASMTGTAPTRRHFEFNRFEVTLDAKDDIALIEDVLDASDAGMERVQLSELISALQA